MKRITILTIITFFSLTLLGQSIYIKPFAGYGFNINEDILTEESSYYYENNDTIINTYSYEAFKLSNGKGPKYGLAVGFDISKNIAFEIDVLYTKSTSSEVSYTDEVIHDFNTEYYLNLFHSYYLESSSWQISPELSIKCNPALFIPYLKLGAIIGSTGIKDYYDIHVTTNMLGYYPFGNMNRMIEYEKRSSVGFTSTIGCDISLGDNFYIFTELRYSNIYYTPLKAEVIEYNVNGDDELRSLTNNERYFEFVEAYSSDDNNDPDEPRKMITQRFALNNISIIAGLKFSINLKRNSKSE